MAVTTARDLKEVLFEAYDGFADKRYRNIDRDAPFIVDDRGPGDYDARKQLFLWFCLMFASVEAFDRVQLTFRGGTPQNKRVTEWFDRHAAKRDAAGIVVDITPGNVDALEDLAKAFESVIRAQYDTKAYKFVVPRVAASLRRLQGVLAEAWAGL